MPIIRSSRVLYRWLLPVVFGALVFKMSVWCGAEGYVSGLRPAVNISDYVRSLAGLLMNDKSEGNGRNRSMPNWRYYRKTPVSQPG